MKDIVMLHDVDGRIYFHALEYLKNRKELDNIDYYQTRITKRVIKCFLRREGSYFECIKNWFHNFKFRLLVPFIKNKNIILGTAPYDFRFIWYGLLARKNKVIYHTSWPYWWTDNVPYKYYFLKKPISYLFKYYFNNYNFEVVCVSEPVKNSINKELKSDVKVKVIPHAVDLSLFDVKNLSNTKDKINVLYVGRMVKHKGIFEIISVADKLKETHNFTLVGKGDDLAEAKKLSFGMSNVFFHNHETDRSNLAKIFKMNDVFILPSKKTDSWEELFGMVIIEAMACGLLVIATDHVGPRGLIKDSINGFLISESDLENKIMSMLVNIEKDNIKAIGLQASKDVEIYNISNVSDLWLEEFKSFFWSGLKND